MDFSGSSSEPWRPRMIYNQSQKATLQAWFQHNLYPDGDTQKQLAKVIGIPASKIQTWFKRNRNIQRNLESGCYVGKDQTQEHSQSQRGPQEYLPQKARQLRMALVKAQGKILLQAFKSNRFPDTPTRKKLAKQTGLKESRIHMWFQNQRSLYAEQSTREPMSCMVGGTDGRPDLTSQQQQIPLSAPPVGTDHFPSSDSLGSNQTFLPALLPSHEFFVLLGDFRVWVSQDPRVLIMQRTQADQEGENPDPPLNCVSPLPEQPAPGGDLSNTQASFWRQFQEKCQNFNECPGTGVLHIQDCSQPHAEPMEQPPQDLGDIDIPYIMQWWDKGRQALIEEWETLQGTH